MNSKAAARRPIQYWRFGLWALVIVGCLVWLSLALGRGYHFDTSIMALLPAGHQSPGQQLAQRRLVDQADDRLLILLASSDKTLSAQMAAQLRDDWRASGLFSRVQGQVDAAQKQQWQQFYQPYRYQLLSPKARAHLLAGDGRLVDESLGRLFSPLASLVGQHLIDDPLQLFFDWQMQALPRSAFAVEDGWLTLNQAGRHYRLLLLTLNSDPYDMAYQQAVMTELDRAKERLPAAVGMLRSGLVIHAAFGASQARHEISTIGVGSALGILLILWLSFRRLSRVALAFLPVLVGCVFALAISLALFDRVHLITLAFGAGLIGVAIDYALHYLCALGRDEPPVTTLRRILPSLSLGLVSSVLAYAAQGFAPFPGLQQMALFSALGLVGAWLTVVCWLPILVARGALPSSASARGGWMASLLRHWPRLDSAPALAVVAVAVVVLMVVVARIDGSDDLRLLQTSPAQLLAEDSKVQQLIGGDSFTRYLLLQAVSEQSLLELEEQTATALDELVARGELDHFSAVSRQLPSARRQRENYQLVAEQVYGADGLLSQLTARANLPEVEALAREQFSRYKFQSITPADWLASAVSEAGAHLWLGQDAGKGPGKNADKNAEEHPPVFYSLITVAGPSRSGAALTGLAGQFEGVEYVDRVQQISQLMGHYRAHLNRWLLLAYAVVAALLVVRYRRAAWRVMMAPALASLLTLAGLALIGSTITVFHTLALLLVLGIGLDASIFLQDSVRPSESWTAVTLSALTTLLAFGLLALSATPVLHYFGVTVLIGIVLVWLLVPCFAKTFAKNFQQES